MNRRPKHRRNHNVDPKILCADSLKQNTGQHNGDHIESCLKNRGEELAEAMIELARNPEKREKMGEVGFERVKAKYQISQMQQTYKELYNKIFRFNYPDRVNEIEEN